MEEKWRITKQEDHVLELEVPDFPDNKTQVPPFQAFVRFDGCVHLYRHNNHSTSPEDTDYFHICNVDEMIAMLQELKQKARAHFKDDEFWPA
jgi:hypothetical protein